MKKLKEDKLSLNERSFGSKRVDGEQDESGHELIKY